MEPAELPTFYGQKINGQTIESPSTNQHSNSSTTDLPTFSNVISSSSAQRSPSFQEKRVNNLLTDSSINPNLRQRPQSSNGTQSQRLGSSKGKNRERSTRRLDHSSSRQQYENSSYTGDGSEGDYSSMDFEEYRQHRRRYIRRKLKKKHDADVVPLRLPWTKWMHSDYKNRMF